ncbi:MAG: serine/threonine protein kinase [Dissulfurimicrobium sp.]|uniref:serine/threonine protein kinase n=1 Tax=Dissulfurimicrobium TaxID=1769732 RepID=UPI001EDAE56D|nr:serine/threonine protein kinase [Dissulfurimicrobium hydrothermale]UKL13164.1 serine/threonine protein kinase [Dissulfurimicrobium hydrothermale]
MSEDVRQLIKDLRPNLSIGRFGRIFTDTTEYMEISYGDVIALGGLHYLVLRDEAERSFGIEDPKYWVKRCTVLETGDRRILKLVFHESFPLQLGKLVVKCYRSPEKEARILALVRGDRRFMQGITIKDERGNPVRIIDIIRGKRLDETVADIEADHRTYFFEFFPEILEKFMGACEAIEFLHSKGEKHGDIRRDHLWIESGTGHYRWIDFDYTYDFHENPFGLDIFGLGSIFIFLAGKGIYNLQAIEGLGRIEARLVPGDFSLLYPNRLVNLKKVFPYIPDELNRVCMHFSSDVEVFYESVDEFLRELDICKRVFTKKV